MSPELLPPLSSSNSLFLAFLQFASALQEFDFLRQALWINFITGLAAAPLGVFLILRRMSLMGDALSHALLPGVAVSYFFFGLSVPAMALGGFLAGTLVVLLTVWAQKHSPLKEDSTFAGFYLLALALGVLAISVRGNSMDLIHILFGSPLTASNESLLTTLGVCATVLVIFIFLHRLFLLEIFDSVYLASRGYRPPFYQALFLVLVVACLVVSFQTNGTLLAMGQLILPALIARLWFQRMAPLIVLALVISVFGSSLGLFISYDRDWPLGPSILALWGFLYFLSLVLNPQQGLFKNLLHRKHYEH